MTPAPRAPEEPNGGWRLGASLVSSLRAFTTDLWGDPTSDGSLPPILGEHQAYQPQRLLAQGDIADVHLATVVGASRTQPTHVLKIALSSASEPYLDREAAALERLTRAAGTTIYRRYLPDLVERLTTTTSAPRRLHVFALPAHRHTLQEIHRQHPTLEGEHLAWIFKRLLEALGFVHAQGLVHGAILPDHVLIDAPNHGACLIGWGHAVRRGRTLEAVPAVYGPWYPPEIWARRPITPATDLYLAARCMVYLAGGDPTRDQFPDIIPAPMQRFFRSCLLPGASMRPDDAWALHEEFDEMLRQLYGPPQFHPLTLV